MRSQGGLDDATRKTLGDISGTIGELDEKAKDDPKRKSIWDNIVKYVKTTDDEGVAEAMKCLFGFVQNSFKDNPRGEILKKKMCEAFYFGFLLLKRLMELNSGGSMSEIVISIVKHFMNGVFLFIRDRFLNSALIQAIKHTFRPCAWLMCQFMSFANCLSSLQVHNNSQFSSCIKTYVIFSTAIWFYESS